VRIDSWRGGDRWSGLWTLIDQGLSSLSNALIVVLVAREVAPRAFGAFSLGYSIVVFGTCATRAFVSESLIVRHGGHGLALSAVARRALGTSLDLGIVFAAVLALAAVAMPADLHSTLLVLALSLPAVCLQDCCRYLYFAAGRPQFAALNDGIWTVAQIVLVILSIKAGHRSSAALAAAWALAAAVAAAVAVVHIGGLPRVGSVVTWAREYRDLCWRYVIEFSAMNGSLQSSQWGVAAVGGLGVLSGLQGAQVLLGPVRVILLAAGPAAVPEMRRRAEGDPARLGSLVRRLGLALAVSAGVYGLLVSLIPNGLGHKLLGASWPAAHRVLPVLSGMWVAVGLFTGLLIGLRVLAASRLSFRSRLTSAPLVVVLPIVGAALWGAPGAAAGLVVANVFLLGITAMSWRVALRAHVASHEPTAEPDAVAMAGDVFS
jgi:O-antigen/teichoic acid export membrane protein